MKLTLISTPICPFVQRAVIALKEKGVAHDVVYVDLENKPDWFLEISPLGKVPLLKVEEAGKAPAYIFESSVIVEFIEETSEGRMLHPGDAVERAGHRSWMEFASQSLIDHMKYVSAKTEEEQQVALASFRAKLERLDATVKGPYFSGETFHLVDAAFAPLFRQLGVLEPLLHTDVLAGLENVQRWRSNLLSRVSVQQAVPTDYPQRYVSRLAKMDSMVGAILKNH